MSLPEIEFKNLFDVDHSGQMLWKHYLGEKVYDEFLNEFKAAGRIAAEATPLSRLADRNPPVLNDLGVIQYHPSYLELQRMSYGEGIVSRKYDAHFLKKHSAYRHRIGFSMAYYFAQTETGLFCPICMTDALGRVLERIPNPSPVIEKTLKHIASKDLNELYQGAMFLTEKQGGSDVGANRVQAKSIDGKWFLSGEKWFCSNADAEASLVLARMPEVDGKIVPGTKGLGLFLLLRNTPQENFKKIKYQRLKDKLGVRSMASAEINLENAEAYLIGGVGEGFKVMTEMVNMSRLYNSVASVALAKRAVIEALEFGKQRSAFGKPLADLTLWKNSIEDLDAEVFGMQIFVFEAIRLLDLFDNGDIEAGKLLRILTPIAKALSGKLAVFASREAMEMIGGNAYIEDHIMPRLLRDALVLPIWEGTTNIQSLDLMRAIGKEGPEVLRRRWNTVVSTNAASELTPLLKSEIEKFESQFFKAELLESSALDFILRLGRLLTLTFLVELSVNPNLKDLCESTFQRLHSRKEIFQSLGT